MSKRRLGGGSGIKRLFADIETSPNVVLAFSAGYNLTINHDSIVEERKVICIGYKWEGERGVHVLRWDSKQDDRSMLIEFFRVAAEADEIVAHFGNGFDIPWLRTRCLKHRLSPIPLYKTIDTKALSSKYFYFNSNKLDYISKFLGHGGKEKMEFEDWKRIVLYRCPKALNKMCHYCGVDVLKLELVFKDIQPYVRPRSHAGVFLGRDKWSCPHCGSEDVVLSKKRVSASGTIQWQMQCKDCGGYFTISDSAYRAYKEAKKTNK